MTIAFVERESNSVFGSDRCRNGAKVEPLMPVDYAIGVGTFAPNNATILHEKRVDGITGGLEMKDQN